MKKTFISFFTCCFARTQTPKNKLVKCQIATSRVLAKGHWARPGQISQPAGSQGVGQGALAPTKGNGFVNVFCHCWMLLWRGIMFPLVHQVTKELISISAQVFTSSAYLVFLLCSLCKE